METFRYGRAPDQYAERWLPPSLDSEVAGRRPPVVILIHGGFWRAQYGLDLMHPLATELTARGSAVWNLEYRRVGSNDADPTVTLSDVRAGIEALVDHHDVVDLDRMAIVGHSAGGHLALWAGGTSLAVEPLLVIGQAAVVDLRRAAADHLGNGATQDFLGGGPDEVPDRYDEAQPRLDPITMHLVHGSLDDTVPSCHSSEAVDSSGRSIPSTIVPNEDHMAVIDPASGSWAVQWKLLEIALFLGSD